MGYDTVQSGRWVTPFRRYRRLPSWGLKGRFGKRQFLQKMLRKEWITSRRIGPF